MTNAVVQNNENPNDIIINTMLNGNNVSNYSDKMEKSNFSNLLNSLSARTQKAQTNFVEKAIKTNTSSINKKALSKDNSKDSTISKIEVDSKGSQLQNVKTKDKSLSDVKDSSKANNVDKVIKNSNSKKNVVNTSENKETVTDDTLVNNSDKITDSNKAVNEVEIEKDVDNKTDINNSSQVESSPVFLPEETIEEDTELSEDVDTDKIVSTTVLPLTGVGQNQVQVEDLIQKTEDIISKIESPNDAVEIVEDISNILDESNLPEQNKENLSLLLDKAKDLIETDVVKSDFDNLITEFNDLVSKIADSNSEVSDDASIESVEISSQDVDLKDFSEISKVLDNFKEILKTDKIDNSEKISQALDNVIEKLPSNADENSTYSLEDLNIAIDELKTTLDDINLNLSKDTDVSVLKENLSEISDILKDVQNDENIVKTDFQNNSFEIEKLSQLNNKLNEVLKDIDLSDIDINSVDETLIKDVLDIFNEFQNSEDDLNISQSLKDSIKDILEQLDNVQKDDGVQQTDFDFQKLGEQIAAIQIQVKDEIKTIDINSNDTDVDVIASDKTSGVQNIKNESNTIDISDVFEKQGENSDSSTEFSNKQNDFQNQTQDDLLEGKVELKEDIETTDDFDIQEKTASVKKDSFITEIKEDILLDIDFSTIPENSGTLSVSDEVARLAMDDVGVLKTDTTFKGSVLYDSASGNVAVIKNAAQMIKGAQTLQNPILNQLENSDLMNQIGDKLTQMKDASAQKLTLVLRPNDLGRLSIELVSDNLGLTTNILAQNEDVRQYIEKNIQTLRQQLTDAGINVNNIQIKTAGQDGSSNYQGNQDNLEQNNQEGHNNFDSQNHKGEQNQKDKQETLMAMSNYDYHFAKDFSGVLNKTINYGLN